MAEVMVEAEEHRRDKDAVDICLCNVSVGFLYPSGPRQHIVDRDYLATAQYVVLEEALEDHGSGRVHCPQRCAHAIDIGAILLR